MLVSMKRGPFIRRACAHPHAHRERYALCGDELTGTGAGRELELPEAVRGKPRISNCPALPSPQTPIMRRDLAPYYEATRGALRPLPKT